MNLKNLVDEKNICNDFEEIYSDTFQTDDSQGKKIPNILSLKIFQNYFVLEGFCPPISDVFVTQSNWFSGITG